jgi:uncharacterized repeat protein (TIGR01451 family)/gliding motility-associated-like protein
LGQYNFTVSDSNGCIITFTLNLPNASEIIANDDNGAVNGLTGGIAVTNILQNDFINGIPVLPSEIILTQLSSSHPNISISGYNVIVAPSTPAGNYLLTYQICELINPTNCDIATIFITVEAAPIIANNDFVSGINGYTGASEVLNIFDNDLLNGITLNPADIILTLVIPDPTGSITLNPSGTIDVASGAPAGTYTLTYQICENLNPANCDDAVVTVNVISAEIIANNDIASNINGTTGAVGVLNVFDNDLLNGSLINTSEVTLNEITPDPNGYLTLNPDGWVDVAPFTPGGTYALTYQICEILNPVNCDQAVVTIQVIPTADVTITKTQISPANLPVGSPANLITVSPSFITAGTKIYYYLSVQNFGPDNSIDALITDIIPAEISNPEYSLNFGNSWFFWDGTRLLSNFQYPGVNNILIRGDVDPSASGTIVNTASIYSTVTFDPDITNNESTLVTAINQSADLVLGKQVINSPVLIGSDIVYQISIFNNGPSVADNVIIQDIIDPAIIINSEYSTDGGLTWLSPWTGSLNIGTLNNQSSFTIQIRGTVIDVSPLPNVNPIPNSASVISDMPDPNPGNNSETIFTPLNTEADVSIVKTGPASVIAGESIHYTITVTNNSNTFDATNVHIHDFINTNILSDAEYSDDAGANWQPWTNLHVVGTLTPLQTFDILIRGNVLSNITADIPNTASVDADTPDSDQTNNTSSINTPVQIISDLEVIKVQIDPAILPIDSAALFGNPYDLSISPQTITAGDTIYYTLIYTNNGPSDVTNVVVDDIIPAGISDVTASRCQFSFAPWMGSISLGDIIAGGRCVLVIKGVVDDNAAGTLINTAVIGNTDGIFDPDLTNNTSTVVTDVRSQADLSIEKTVNNSNPYVGDNIEFTVTVTNNGPNPATGVEVNDLLPNGYSYVSHSAASGSYDHTTGIWTIGNVGFPGSVVLTISVVVNIPVPGINYQNIAAINNLDQLDPDPTNNTDDEITSPVNIIIANDDNGGPVNGFTGSTNVLNVFGNDLLNGAPVNQAALTLTLTVPNPAGYLILNSDGSVDVAPGTPAGSHSLTYQICEIANPGNCDDALVTIIVESAVITAVDDDVTGVNGYTGQNDVLNVFNNDLLNGFPLNPANVNLAETVADPTGALTLNPDGSVDVAPGTPAGTYTLTYEICEILNPTNCDDAVVTVTVIAAPIVANDDNAFDINGYTGQNDVLNVFNNDELNGSPVIPAEVTLTETVADPTGALTLNPDGSVDVAPGTPAGTYTLTYEICEILNPTNCDDAVVTVTVIAGPIVANDDNASGINGYTGQNNVLNVFNNDLLSGIPVIPAEVTLTEIIPDPNGFIILNSDGSVDVSSYTPAGNYTLSYLICEVLNPGNCDNATVIINVIPAVIFAEEDVVVGVNGHSGATGIINVLDNDSLNGIQVNPLEISLVETVPDPFGFLLLNPDGTVDVAPGTPTGTYTLIYEICELLNLNNCSDAPVFVSVIAPVIEANDDFFAGINGYTGHNNILNVLDNDLLDGVPVIPAEVTLTETVVDPTGALTLNPDGSVDVAPGTPAGTYTLTYEICEILNPTNCDDAVVTVTVIAAPIVAVDDVVTGISGGFGAAGVVNIFDNDSLNGVPVIPSEITLAEIIPDPAGALTLNPDGTLDVASGTSPGTYTLTYEICEILNPSNCDQALATVIVVNDPPVALDDFNDTHVNTPVWGNVLTNDWDPNGDPITMNTVPVTDPVNGTLVLNPDGSYIYTPNSGFTGVDTFVYEICDNGTPALCDSALVTITVYPGFTPAENNPPVANNDVYEGIINVPVIGNVISNDWDPDGNLDPNSVTLIGAPPANGTLVLNPDGTFSFTPDVNFTGIVTFEYEICDTGMPVYCDMATVTITIYHNPFNDNYTFAVDDSYSGMEDNPITGNVLDNDYDPEGDNQFVNPIPVVSPVNGTVTLNVDGSFIYIPNPNYWGPDQFVYEVCDDGIPVSCDQATVYLMLFPVNDPPVTVNEYHTICSNSFASGNIFNGDYDPDTTALEVGPVVQLPANGSFVTDSLGNYIYTPDAGFSGIDTVIVDICDTGFPLPAECSHDTIFITVYPEVLITAGGNDTICSDESYLLAGASVVNHGSIFWTTNGTGTFDNHYAMNPVYTPGVTDIMNGSVTLTMHATPQYSVCDNVSASMVLTITPKAEIYTATNLVNCLGGSYAFQGVSVVNSTGILWTTSGDGSFSDDTIANPVYTPGAGDLMAGSVVLTITAQSEAPCSPVSQQIILTYAPELTADITQPSCNGETGEAIINVTGGNAPYSYALNGGIPQAGNTFTGLVPGNYTVVVTDANGCIANIGFVITQPELLELHLASQTNVSCYGEATGGAVVTATGGTPAYSYSIASGPAGHTATVSANVISGMIAGMYEIVVMDANDCTDTLVVIITEPSDSLLITLEEITDPSCYGSTDGSIEIAVGGGTMPYFYAWSNGSIAPVPSNLGAGTYFVTVTDASGCQIIGGPYTLSEPAEEYLTVLNIVNTQCNAAVGQVTIESSDSSDIMLNGVVLPSPATFTGLGAGYYTAYSTGECPASISFNIANDNSTLIATVTVSDALCFGDSVTAVVAATGGTAPYTYTLNASITNTNGIFTNLPSGVYNVLVTDSAGCTYYLAFDVDQPDILLTNILFSMDESCFGADNGMAAVVVSGGTTPYTYLWNDPLSQTAAVATDLPAGTWTVTVTDANGCDTTVSVTIAPGMMTIAEAGPNDTICETTTSYALTGASSSGYTVQYWTTSGTGSFSNMFDTNPVYFPSAADINAGSVILTLTAIAPDPCAPVSDQMVLTISRQAVVWGSTYEEICAGNSFMTNTDAEHYASLLWTSSGDGSFDDATQLYAEYTPGVADIAAGTVTLTLTAQSASPCVSVSHSITLVIIPNVIADAGPDQLLYGATATQMAGNNPTPGTGVWTLISGPNVPFVVDPADPMTAITGLTHGTYIYQWTITNPPCDVTYDLVVITNLAAAELSIEKTADNMNPCAGQPFSYTLTVINHGPVAAQDVVVTEPLPAGLTLLNVIPTHGSWTAPLWNIGTLQAGDTATLTLNMLVDVDLPFGTQLINVVNVASTTLDTNMTNNTDTLIITICTEADLWVDKVVDQAVVQAGDQVVYTITIGNDGPSMASNVTVTDVLPAGVTLISTVPSAGTWSAPVWTVGNLYPGTTETLIITVDTDPSLADGTVITNTAIISSQTTDPDPSNNSSSVDFTIVAGADLEVIKTSSHNPVIAGDTLIYTITVINHGTGNAQNVTVTDILPAGLTPITAVATAGTWTAPVWSLGTVLAGNTETLTITVVVNSDVPHGTTIINSAVVNSTTPDPNMGNNTSTNLVYVEAWADLEVIKTASHDTISGGETLIYTITVHNHGLSDAQGIVMTDILPSEVTLTGWTATTGNWVAPDWYIGTLTAGSQATLTLTVFVHPDITDGMTLSNTATVVAITQDPDQGNNTSTVDVEIFNRADLDVIKISTLDIIYPGDPVTYIITLANNGPADAQQVVVNDVLPSVLSFVSATASAGTWTEPDWTVGTLPAGSTETLVLELILSPDADGCSEVSNTATAESVTFDPDNANNSSTAVFTVACADLDILKTTDYSTVIANELLVYTISVTNHGIAAALDVEISDALPAEVHFVSVDQNGIYDAATHTVNWFIPSIGVNETFVTTITVRVDRKVPGGTVIINTATVTSTTPDPDTLNNTSSVSTEVEALLLPFIPEGFSPNGDGVNDVFVITGLERYPEHTFTIFNRWGNMVFEAAPYNNDWDGTSTFGITVGGNELPSGTYFYIFETGVEGIDPIRGFIYLAR